MTKEAPQPEPSLTDQEQLSLPFQAEPQADAPESLQHLVTAIKSGAFLREWAALPYVQRLRIEVTVYQLAEALTVLNKGNIDQWLTLPFHSPQTDAYHTYDRWERTFRAPRISPSSVTDLVDIASLPADDAAAYHLPYPFDAEHADIAQRLTDTLTEVQDSGGPNPKLV